MWSCAVLLRFVQGPQQRLRVSCALPLAAPQTRIRQGPKSLSPGHRALLLSVPRRGLQETHKSLIYLNAEKGSSWKLGCRFILFSETEGTNERVLMNVGTSRLSDKRMSLVPRNRRRFIECRCIRRSHLIADHQSPAVGSRCLPAP